MINNASFSYVFLYFDVCGGNIEIIHIAEKAINESSNCQDMKSVLPAAISFHHNDLAEYLIDNYNFEQQ